MSRRIAGYSPRPPRGEMHVDYADVLRQAVDNERWRVLRSVREAVERIPTTQESRSRSYGTDPRDAAQFKSDLLKRLDKIEREACDD